MRRIAKAYDLPLLWSVDFVEGPWLSKDQAQQLAEEAEFMGWVIRDENVTSITDLIRELAISRLDSLRTGEA
ncbi:MAG: hypothetical protein AAF845_18950 [Bacteroidota bacterium]